MIDSFFKKNILIKQEIFCEEKMNYHFCKKMIYSFMAGIFAGLGYLCYLLIYSYAANNGLLGVARFLAAFGFPGAMFFIMYMGGNLFTSNSLLILGIYKKKYKIYSLFLDLLITLLFNAIGAIFIASLIFASNIFGEKQIYDTVIDLATHKINMEWWQAFTSGLVCNLFVAGSVYIYASLNNKIIGFLTMFILIYMFALSGSQHIVANFFIISEAGFLSLDKYNGFTNEQIGKIFTNNLIPTMFGNMLMGFFIPTIYMLANIKNNKNKDTIITI